MIKAHSAGVGDLLRSSAAWRSLKNRYPGARLHLVLLTKEPGYLSEEFIAQHHLLESFHVLDKRNQPGARQRLAQKAQAIADVIQPDLVIDFEPHGLRTSMLARLVRRRCRAVTVGIAEVPFRRFFYDQAAASCGAFARRRGLGLPLEYTNRDYVALAALGIERNGTPIELELTKAGAVFNQNLHTLCGLPAEARIMGVNIGCGTPGAGNRRPNLEVVSTLTAHLQTCHGLSAVLTGGSYEAETNRAFKELHANAGHPPVLDLAGKTSLTELTGLIKACALFVSGDSGPYHMAVALRIPTLALFNQPHPVAYHHHPWVRTVVAPKLDSAPAAMAAADELLLNG